MYDYLSCQIYHTNSNMNKKEIVNYLKENMPNFTGDSIEQEKKKALYIYMELGKMKTFDEKYYFGNSKTKEKIYRLSQREKRHSELMAEKKKLICVTISYLYKSILKEFGIKSYVSEPAIEGGHVYNVMCLKNGQMIHADLQMDMYHIQTKTRLKHFGNRTDEGKGFVGVSQEEIFNMQKEMGYIKNEDEYRNTVIEKLLDETEGLPSDKLLERLLTDKSINRFDSKIEYMEFYKYYTLLLRMIESKHKLKNSNIHSFSCYRNRTNSEGRDYSMCIYAINNDKPKIYLSSNKNNGFMEVDLDTLNELESNGLFLGFKPDENGVNLLRKYLNRRKKEKVIEKYR